MLNTGVTGAEFDTKSSRWNVKLTTGEIYDAKFFVLCTGFAAKRHVPNFPGMEKYKGIMHHTGMILDPRQIKRRIAADSSQQLSTHNKVLSLRERRLPSLAPAPQEFKPSKKSVPKSATLPSCKERRIFAYPWGNTN